MPGSAPGLGNFRHDHAGTQKKKCMRDQRVDHLPLKRLIGEQLTAVVFILDYVQLQFSNGSTLTALTWPSVDADGTATLYGMPNYRDALCERIAKTVRAGTVVEGENLRVEFDDDSVISVSLKPEDYSAAEAAVLDHGADDWWSW
jgi:hypothetical protein